jgi:ribosome-associated toxin RatA of RatAB toxin-antitoxin module
MSKNNGREIHCYDYVNHPYKRVRDALSQDALAIFRLATKSAASRAQTVATELHVDVGGVGIKANVKVQIKSVEEKVDTIPSPTTRLMLEWEAASLPGLFPVMQAELSIYPLTPTETQLDFLGHYEPPFGMVGKAMNAVVGYRIAEASVHTFITNVAEYLRQTLGK